MPRYSDVSSIDGLEYDEFSDGSVASPVVQRKRKNTNSKSRRPSDRSDRHHSTKDSKKKVGRSKKLKESSSSKPLLKSSSSRSINNKSGKSGSTSRRRRREQTTADESPEPPEPTSELAKPKEGTYAYPKKPGFHTLMPFSFLLSLFLLVIFPFSIHRDHIRTALWLHFGATRDPESGRYSGGNRELATVVYLLVGLGVLTLTGALVSILANGPSTLTSSAGIWRDIFRFLHRQPLPQFARVSFGEMGFVSGLMLINTVWFFSYYDRFEDMEYKQSIAYACGLVAVLNLVFLGLPVSRDSFWMQALGIDYTHGLVYHRGLAYLVFALILAHVLPFFIYWAGENELAVQFDTEAGIENIFGLVAFVSLIVVIVTSLPIVRRRYYEVFYFCHHFYLLFFVGMCLHYSSFVFFMYPATALYLCHRIIARAQSRYPVEVLELVPLSKGSSGGSSSIIRLVLRRSKYAGGQYLPGQIIYLRIPAISSLEWHPFSISSYPEHPDMAESFSVHIRSLGNWTESLARLASTSSSSKKKSPMNLPLVYVDGFYGQIHNRFDTYPVLLFFAGGIGATPIMSILGHLLHRVQQVEKNAESRSREEPTTEHLDIRLYWTCRELDLFKEFEPLLNAIKAFDPEESVFKIRLAFTGGQASLDKEQQVVLDMPAVGKEGDGYVSMHDAKCIRYPFHQSCRSPTRRAILFLVTFSLSGCFLGLMRYDYPILGENNEHQHLKPYQRLLELLVMVFGACLGYFVAMSEDQSILLENPSKRGVNAKEEKVSHMNEESFSSADSRGWWAKVREKAKAVRKNKKKAKEEGKPPGTEELAHPISTSRFAIKEILSECAKEYESTLQVYEKGIGIWVSGPPGLMNTISAEAGMFKDIYDVHHEEFLL